MKALIYQHCLQQVTEHINQLQSILADLRQSTANETKSTAGDKYETARAILHIEQENTNRQLAEALAKKAALQSIDVNSISNKVSNGSLVTTNKGLLFISIAMGKMIVDNKPVIVFSPQSPLGSKLMGLGVGESAAINNTTYLIEAIE